MVKHDGWKLRILGDGSDRELIRQKVESLHLENSVEMPGYVSDVQSEIQKASIFVSTSLYEGFMLSLLEVMSQCCVPVSYKTPYGPLDIIEDGVNGILVDMHDKETFATKLSELMSDKKMIDKMSLSAYHESKSFEAQAICEEWMKKYNQLREEKFNK